VKRYKETGVDIQGSDEVVKEIKRLAENTYSKNVLAGVGLFAAMYDLSAIKAYRQPVFALSVDGVGTKPVVAKMMSSLRTCGIDLVNHCINDVLCQGAKPIIFMDYIAQDRLRKEEIVELVGGMSLACKEAGISLVGGETAQMPAVFKEEELDLVGFMVGLVEKDDLIDGSKIEPGDILIGLPSNGLHTNGYSLVRDIFFEEKGGSPYFWFKELGGQLGRILLQPHKSYLQPLSLLFRNHLEVSGIAHITGGGLPGNIPRILPEGCQAQIRLRSWPVLPIFQFIQKQGKVPLKEMYQVFNMGIGMVLVVPPRVSLQIYRLFDDYKIPFYVIGAVNWGKKGVTFYTADSH